MADYAGAKAAIRARLAAAWTTTRITYQNEQPAEPWPPVNASAELEPWVNLEVVGGTHTIDGVGRPGNRVWRYDGNILIHVFVPVGTGVETANLYAQQIGEVFRAAQFYDADPGCCIRTLAPSIDDGGSADDDGNWFRVTVSIDFTYWHRA